MKRDEILSTAEGYVNGPRASDYGPPEEDFGRTGRMWAAVLGLDEVTPAQVAICLALVKVSRLCNTPEHQDSWVDICGYAALGAECADDGGRHA